MPSRQPGCERSNRSPRAAVVARVSETGKQLLSSWLQQHTAGSLWDNSRGNVINGGFYMRGGLFYISKRPILYVRLRYPNTNPWREPCCFVTCCPLPAPSARAPSSRPPPFL